MHHFSYEPVSYNKGSNMTMTETPNTQATTDAPARDIEWKPDPVHRLCDVTEGTKLMALSVVEHLEQRRRDDPAGQWVAFDEEKEDAFASAIIAAWSCGLVRVRVLLPTPARRISTPPRSSRRPPTRTTRRRDDVRIQHYESLP